MSRAADSPPSMPLVLGIGSDASSRQVAAALSSRLQEIDMVLLPIVGARGVEALFSRSVHLASGIHGWLSAAKADREALLAAVAARSDAEAAAGAQCYLHELQALLVGLIGPSLTERMLAGVRAADPTRSIPQVPQ